MQIATLARLRDVSPATLADGGAAARRRAVAIDAAISDLAAEAAVSRYGIAVAAVGGYGRGELSPCSDIDLLILTPPRDRLEQSLLKTTLYPLWDAGFEVGHSVRTPKDAVEHAAHDTDSATALLSARLVCGSQELFDDLMARVRRWIDKDSKRIARRIFDAHSERRQRVEAAGWTLAPDIKEDAGGLRDLHAVIWLSAVAQPQRIATRDLKMPERLTGAGEVLLAVREALHGEAGRKLDRVRIDLQGAVAGRLGIAGDDGADVLMAEVHRAARTIEFGSDEALATLRDELLGGPKRSGSSMELAAGIRIEDGQINVHPVDEVDDLTLALQAVAAASAAGKSVARRSASWLRTAFDTDPIVQWSDQQRSAFLRILAGTGAVEALHLLDDLVAWDVLLPEWSRVRGRAQHDPYHRHTVDGHLFLTVAEVSHAIELEPVAREAAAQAGDVTTLLFAALLHDAGKGSGEDHSVAGERIARAAAARMGFLPTDAFEIAHLVRHHLLLVDTATRRDIDDAEVVARVAETVGSARVLRLLYVLTIADGRATGPAGWSQWKDALVQQLFRKVLAAFETGDVAAAADSAVKAREIEDLAPDLAGRSRTLLASLPDSYLESTASAAAVEDLRLLLAPRRPGEVRFRTERAAGHDIITLCVDDRPGTLARAAGVCALHRFSVLSARAYSSTTGVALQKFVVDPPAETSWTSFGSDLEAAFTGRLAVEAQLEKKIRDYHHGAPISPEVRILQDVSAHSSIVEVRAPDTLGLLHAIAAALGEMDLDIRMAKIDTLGRRVVDVFYVRSAWGAKLDSEQAAEVAVAIEHRVQRLFGA